MTDEIHHAEPDEVVHTASDPDDMLRMERIIAEYSTPADMDGMQIALALADLQRHTTDLIDTQTELYKMAIRGEFDTMPDVAEYFTNLVGVGEVLADMLTRLASLKAALKQRNR